MTLYFFDTNVIIDIFGQKKSARFLSAQLAASARFATSFVSVAEFLVKASSSEEKTLLAMIADGELAVHPLDSVDLAKSAAQLRKTHSIKMPDALILASARSLGAHFLSFDRDLIRVAKKVVAASIPE